jgi:hypothetical protein
MKKWLLAGMVLSLMVIALTQPVLGKGSSLGPLTFDPKTVETVQGIVIDAPEFKPGGIPEMVHLTLKTKPAKLTVVLGPNWFVARQDWKISALDRLEVTGSRFILDGQPALIAQTVKKGDKIMKFRDESGRPLWVPAPPQTQ